MALFLEIIEGPEKGQRYRLQEGIQIGRTQGDIRLTDVKASGLHAQIEKDKKGQLILIDKDSFNGLKINGNKVKRIAMLAGVSFQIGKTYFKVLRLFGEENETPKKSPSQTSREMLLKVFEKLQVSSSSVPQSILPFENPVELKFIEGMQAEASITLGYGPRKAGANCFDIEIEEPLSPAVAFEVEPTEAGALFTTQYSNTVVINEVPTSQKILNTGDTIRIGNTLIEVRILL
jgi:pSer/pThr/pTyr-binding forkhead associated (FHA) protein